MDQNRQRGICPHLERDRVARTEHTATCVEHRQAADNRWQFGSVRHIDRLSNLEDIPLAACRCESEAAESITNGLGTSDLAALLIQNLTSDMNRFAERAPRREVHTVLDSRHERAAFRVEIDFHFAELNRDRLHLRLLRAAVVDRHGQLSVAVSDVFGQAERDDACADIIGQRFLLAHFAAIDRCRDTQLRLRQRSPFGSQRGEIRFDQIAGTVTAMLEFDLLLESRHTVLLHDDLALFLREEAVQAACDKRVLAPGDRGGQQECSVADAALSHSVTLRIGNCCTAGITQLEVNRDIDVGSQRMPFERQRSKQDRLTRPIQRSIDREIRQASSRFQRQ